MEPNKLYKLKRGNQNQTVGLIVKGIGASVNVLGSQSRPTSLADMEDCRNGDPVLKGTATFSILPEYIYFNGVADSVEMIGTSGEDLNISF